MTPHRESRRRHHRNHEQQAPPGALFYCFAAVLLFGILFLGMPVAQSGAGDRRYRDLFLLLTGVLALVGGLMWGRIGKVRPEAQHLEDRVIVMMGLSLPVWALLQWIPLPLFLVAILSPARAALERTLDPLFGGQTFSSLSVAPPVTLTHFLLLCGYAAMMFAAREFAVRARRRVWLVASPILVAGTLEAVLALLQFGSGGVAVRGTFAIRNHLAGFLEMALPLAIGFGVSAFASQREDGGKMNWPRAGGGLALAVLCFTAGMVTLSRGGFGGILGALLVVAVFSVGRGMPITRRLLFVTLFLIVVLAVVFTATPLSLIMRLGTHDSEGRLSVWSEAIHLVGSYPLTGVGLGGFESSFLKYKFAEGQFVVDYAHNDYLQGLTELGIVGFAMVALLLGAVVIRSGRMAMGTDASSDEESDEGVPVGMAEIRWGALGCLAAVIGILIHSGVDFNLYIPANAASLAWICGMAAGLTPSTRRRRRTVEVRQNTTRNAHD